jgi:DNA-binding transcriptional LysR family regulator
MADRLIKMLAFVRTAELGSFSAAGAALAISSQIVGRHVASLEKQLGVQLLTRSTRQQSLTEAGRLYLDACRHALAMVDAADNVLAVHASQPSGTLRITAPVEIGAAVIAPKLSEFLAMYPDVSVNLFLNDRTLDLVQENYDAGIRIGHLADSNLTARGLAPFRLVTCASEAYLASHGVPSDPNDLAEHDCLDYSFHGYPAPRNWVFQSPDGEIAVFPKARLSINDGHALVEAALAGGGIIQASELAVKPHLQSGSLKTLLEAYPSPTRPMHVVFPHQKFKVPKLRVFVDWIAETLSPP